MSLQERLDRGAKWDGDCLVWVGTKLMPDGYARFTYQGKKQLVHRAVWADVNGPIPPGWQVDHVAERGCKHRNCVLLEHLEAVPAGVNTRRASVLGDLCRSGRHNAAETGWIIRGDARTCAACHAEATARHRERRRAGAPIRARTVVSDEQVQVIRDRHASVGGPTIRALAEEYGVSAAHMGRIVRGRVRSHPDSNLESTEGDHA